MRLLSSVDYMFVRLETPNTPMHIGAVATFKLPEDAGPTYVRDLRDAIGTMEERPFPFNAVISPGLAGLAARWQDVRPDPSYHVRLSALPSPGGEAELGALVELLHSSPLDMSKPLWECHLIEGLSDNRFALYFKAHHGAVDGMGAMNLIKAWFSTEPNGTPLGFTSVHNTPEETGVTRALVKAVASRAASGIRTLPEVLGRIAKMSWGKNAMVPASLSTPRTLFNTKLTRHRRVSTQLLELDRLKSVAKATGTTVNDVLLASVSGALRRYLMEAGALPNNSLTVSIPVGFDRDETTLNAAAGFVAPIGTEIADPLERVKRISAATKRGKQDMLSMSSEAQQQFTLLGLVPLFASQKTGRLVTLPPLFNFTVSNVVLSPDPLYLGGAELELFVPASFLVDGYGLNLTLVGYNGKVALGYIGCRDVIPHLQRLGPFTSEAFAELEKAAGLG
ncbi:wax ester/triacylglycerol synthase family O-acyltransferase [Spongiibacter sp. KMU-158]|uniref:diacylglycerol O-acyltransferase n=1 Tax=Spongiibacter pelagi TaxID=2760804 RepID=A0A927C215_9GAMM|nr:wax ester/triacylglycerol synthase family O-acyltransferase [Spongiibacter pelagi]MBD2859845.1 wax ester/triacylglycerol synthase family O-acyltransferase [Spongiibacter pelagi]